MDRVPGLPQADAGLLGSFYVNEKENFEAVKKFLVEILQNVGLWAATLPMATLVLGMCAREFPGRGITLESIGVSHIQKPLCAMAKPGLLPNDVTRLVFEMKGATQIIGNWMWEGGVSECDDLFEVLQNVKLVLHDLVMHLNMGALRDAIQLNMGPALDPNFTG